MAKKTTVFLTANFEHNLESIEAFLTEAEAHSAFDELLEDLLITVIPNLERFPDMGRSFLGRQVKSVEVTNALTALLAKSGNGDIREYLHSDYLLLYAHYEETIYLLSIKHHRQLSFDFNGNWPTT